MQSVAGSKTFLLIVSASQLEALELARGMIMTHVVLTGSVTERLHDIAS